MNYVNIIIDNITENNLWTFLVTNTYKQYVGKIKDELRHSTVNISLVIPVIVSLTVVLVIIMVVVVVLDSDDVRSQQYYRC